MSGLSDFWWKVRYFYVENVNDEKLFVEIPFVIVTGNLGINFCHQQFIFFVEWNLLIFWGMWRFSIYFLVWNNKDILLFVKILKVNIDNIDIQSTQFYSRQIDPSNPHHIQPKICEDFFLFSFPSYFSNSLLYFIRSKEKERQKTLSLTSKSLMKLKKL